MHRGRGPVDVIINARSGAHDNEAAAGRIRDYFSSRGIVARVQLIRTPADISAAAGRAARGDSEVVVAGGGDGTIAAVVTSLLDTPKPLGVLPLGTFNYFARRIGVPLDLDGALDVITGGAPRAVSVGEVNGRVFLNNSSIGLYPAILKQRESTYRRFGRSQAAAYVSVAFVLLRPPGFLQLEVTADGQPIARETPLLFVGVNPQQMAEFAIPGYECVNDGRLAIYVTRPLSAGQLWRLGLRGFFRGLHGASELEVMCARDLQVGVRRKRVRVAMDGEIVRLRSPLRYRLREDALHVLSAAAADGPGSGS